jgi:16S rRNA (adenine1518-N6/adenine1519-N6)-dimethyltransferase
MSGKRANERGAPDAHRRRAGVRRKWDRRRPTTETGFEVAVESAVGDLSNLDGPPDLTNPGQLRALLRRHGVLRTNKSLGQHLLVSRAALADVVQAAELTSEDAVLEVGAGTGVLTVELAERAARVVAVELDRALLSVLRETTARFANVTILPKNLLEVEPAEVFDRPYKVVANLPYYITALTLRHFLEAKRPPRLLVVMVQREVAERIVARGGLGGGMSLLGLSVQVYGKPQIVATVPPDAFYPPPKVESAVVRVELDPQPPLSPAARDRLFQLAHAGFAEKRKQLHNSLARHLDTPPETIHCWLAHAAIDPARRAQTLSLEDWLRLTRVSLSGECD